MRVSVYYNLHRHTWSLRAETGALRGRVIAHAEALRLDGVTCHVGPAGRARVRRTGQKHVHAFVRGRLTAISAPHLTARAREAELVLPVSDACLLPAGLACQAVRFSYDPRIEDAFTTRGEDPPRPVARGRAAIFCAGGRAYMLSPACEMA